MSFCVVIAGRLPGAGDEQTVWDTIAKGFKLDAAQFAERMLPRLPMTVKHSLGADAAALMAHRLQAMGVDARALADDGRAAVFERDGVVKGPLPIDCLNAFIRVGERYRLSDTKEWSTWSVASEAFEAFDVDAALNTSTTLAGPWDRLASLEELSPPLPGNLGAAPRQAVAIEPPLSPTNYRRARRPVVAKRSTQPWGWLVAIALVVVVCAACGYIFLLPGNGSPLRSVAAPQIATAAEPRPSEASRSVRRVATTPHAAVEKPASAQSLQPAPATPSGATPTLTSPVATPSFDCGKASALVEVAICSDSTLSRLDNEMAGAYRRARTRIAPEQAAALKDDQRQWLKDRAECGSDASCIATRLRSRADQLDAIRSAVESPVGAVPQHSQPSAEQYQFEQASDCYREGNYVCAIQMANTILNTDPNDARAFALLQRADAAQRQNSRDSSNRSNATEGSSP